MSDNNKSQEQENEKAECSSSKQGLNNIMQAYQEQLLLQQQLQLQQQNDVVFGVNSPWSNFQPVHHQFQSDPVYDQFLIPPPPPPSSSYTTLFNRRPPAAAAAAALQFGYDSSLGPVTGSVGPFSLQAEIEKMSAQEIMDAKALAASKSHSEAERRRRERINNHLAKLRSLLPSTTKTDKASLLAEVIQHVKELKRQTTIIAETSPVPTESDELTVDTSSDEDGKFIIKASICCEDRTDLLPDLIKTLKALRLKTLKAEITTLGGRVKNVLFITGDENENNDNENFSGELPTINLIQEALKAVMEKSSSDSNEQQTSSGSVKRQRTTNVINIYEQHI